jgi:hypothetical protein
MKRILRDGFRWCERFQEEEAEKHIKNMVEYFLQWPIGKAFYHGTRLIAVFLDEMVYIEKVFLLRSPKSKFQSVGQEVKTDDQKWAPDGFFYAADSHYACDHFLGFTENNITRFSKGLRFCDAHIKITNYNACVMPLPEDRENYKPETPLIDMATRKDFNQSSDYFEQMRGNDFCSVNFSHRFKISSVQELLKITSEFIFARHLLNLIGHPLAPISLEPMEFYFYDNKVIFARNSETLFAPANLSSLDLVSFYSDKIMVDRLEATKVDKIVDFVTLGLERNDYSEPKSYRLLNERCSCSTVAVFDYSEGKVYGVLLEKEICDFYPEAVAQPGNINMKVARSQNRTPHCRLIPMEDEEIYSFLDFFSLDLGSEISALDREALEARRLNPLVCKNVPLIEANHELLLFYYNLPSRPYMLVQDPPKKVYTIERKSWAKHTTYFPCLQDEDNFFLEEIDGEQRLFHNVYDNNEFPELGIVSNLCVFTRKKFLEIMLDFLDKDTAGLVLEFMCDYTLDKIGLFIEDLNKIFETNKVLSQHGKFLEKKLDKFGLALDSILEES